MENILTSHIKVFKGCIDVGGLYCGNIYVNAGC